MQILWMDGRLQAQPATEAERDALLLLWQSTKRGRREGNSAIASDFGAKFDGESNDNPPFQAACDSLTIE